MLMKKIYFVYIFDSTLSKRYFDINIDKSIYSIVLFDIL